MQPFCRFLKYPVYLLAAASVWAQLTPIPADKYTWLEDVHGDRALAWVRAENERTARVLEKDPRYSQLVAEALKVRESPDRLAMPQLIGGEVFNTWQDAAHVRGILRRTSLDDYLAAEPHWHTLLDYDALAAKDKQSWVQHGRACLYPGNEVCLIALSAGGEDASTEREFNLKTGQFVENGFTLPTSKQWSDWLDANTLLVARDWGSHTLTKSGYPFIVKIWKRGEPLDQAHEIFRGTENDVRVGFVVLHDSLGHRAVILDRGVTFFEHEVSILTSDGVKRIAIPLKVDVGDLMDGQLLVSMKEDWTPAGTAVKFVSGSVLAFDLEALTKDPAHPKPTVVFAPTAREFMDNFSSTKDHLLLTTLDNVQGRAYVYTRKSDGGWTRERLAVPDNRSVGIVTTNPLNNQFFLSLTGFLTPSSLWLGDASTLSLKEAKSLRPQFDARNQTVEQLEATSKDGTKVPYFVVRRKDFKYDGSNPTLLTAYGGFEVSNTPYYSPVVGKLWLERGGVYVLANIRGGGEFGPAWHEAGLKTHRQRIYDDFYAVAEDLIKRKITSPRRLGIMGGSNGGLLMGVEMIQHPAMWNAIVIDVPLLDMLGFEHIAAGASWVGEYGSVSVPAERAFLASISPYQNLKPDVKYPEPLIFTTTKDDRVGPVHARKFAAKMEEFHEPFFYDEIIEGGHSGGADLKEQAQTDAVQYVYLMRKLFD